MKQILLITDGCSNVGLNPVVAAAHALAEGIVVNVVGIVDQGEIGALGAEEIAGIAQAGGGLSRIAGVEQLSQTVQALTRRTVTHTIRQAVGRELQRIIGSGEVTDLAPQMRSQVIEAMDELAETEPLQVVLLVDASASMKPKLGAVREAVRDLMASLQARSGVSELAVFHFPGPGYGEEVCLDAGWSSELAKIPRLFYNLNMKGTTPTGPALLRAVRYFGEARSDRSGGDPARRLPGLPLPEPSKAGGQDGVLSDYVV